MLSRAYILHGKYDGPTSQESPKPPKKLATQWAWQRSVGCSLLVALFVRSSDRSVKQRTWTLRIQPNLPDRGSVFDYVVDLKQPGKEKETLAE